LRIDVAVIGGGPAGLIAARELATKGVKVRVFEEHPNIGKPNHCAGIISIEGLQRIGVEPENEFLVQEIIGGTAFSPNSTGIRIVGTRPRAYVVDRVLFDRYLANQAKNAGAEIEKNFRVTNFIQDKEHVTGILGKRKVEAKIVINAEGASGTLAKKLGFNRSKDGVLTGINANVSNVQVEPKMVEIWLSDALTKGFFAWVLPIGEDYVRCGLATTHGDALNFLQKFVKKRFGLEEFETQVRWPVLTNGPLEKTYDGGILLVGDVAGHVKPTTGGGIILGGMCAIIAAETAVRAIEEENYSAEFLCKYDQKWRKVLNEDFSSMLKIRRFLNNIHDSRMNRIFSSVKSANLESTLEKLVDEGDMDLQSSVIRRVLTHPRMIPVITNSLGRLALKELMSLFNL
jgi:geranylgeranyl reductase family protein